MAALLTLLLLVGGLAVFLLAESAVFRWVTTGDSPRGLSRPVAWLSAHLRHRAAPLEPIPPVLLGLELRRLTEAYLRVEQGDAPHKAARLAACAAAYDEVLLQYCRRLDVPVPAARVPLSSVQRLHVEAELIGAGAQW